MRTRCAAITVMSGALLLTGCAGSRDQRGAAKPDPPPEAFDRVKDPPINANTRFAAGQLAESQANPAMAVKQYEAALKLEPRHLPALYRLGVVHTQLKQYGNASEIWKRYIKATDGSADGYTNLGFCLELAGYVDQAEAAYRKGIEKDPKHEACRVNYGLMLARRGREAEAVLQLQAVLPPAEVQYNLASVHEWQGRKEQAKGGYRKALELDPLFTDAQTRLAALGE